MEQVNAEHDRDMFIAIARRSAANDACSGTPTEALTPGLVGEMVEALHDALSWGDLLSRLVAQMANKDVGEPEEIARARSILTRLGKASE